MKKIRAAAFVFLAAGGFILLGGLDLFVPVFLKVFSPFAIDYESFAWQGPPGSRFTGLETNMGPVRIKSERADLKAGLGLFPPAWSLKGKLGATLLEPKKELALLKGKIALKEADFLVRRGFGSTFVRFKGIAKEFGGRENVPAEVFFREGLLELSLDGKVIFRLEYKQ